MKLPLSLLACLCLAGTAHAGADLDLKVAYYSRIVTPEGVTREARYEESMLRRARHVWTARILPVGQAPHSHDDGSTPGVRKIAARQGAAHKHFNHVVLPRHLSLDNGQPRLEYVDAHEKQVIAIPPGEYDNVGFDGSWDHAYYLLDPKRLKAMPVTARASTVPGARWREREQDGLFERVLWDERREVPLVIESGDKAATFYNRVELTVQGSVTPQQPWLKTKGFARREYADFLD